MISPVHMTTLALPLADVRVLHIGSTVATALCARVLAALGAQVVFVEHLKDWRPGKQAGPFHPEVVLTSSDQESDVMFRASALAAAGAIVCDITTFGRTGPLCGESLSEQDLQRFSSFATYTGFPDSEAVCAPGYPIDCQAALYATAGVIAGLVMRDRDGAGRVVDIARFDVALNALLTFVPAELAGSGHTRLGNRHPALAPWNIYPTADGWIVICAPTDEQWRRLVTLVNDGASHDLNCFESAQDRIANVEALDELIAQWTRTLGRSECLECLMHRDIPCGEISTQSFAALADMADGKIDPLRAPDRSAWKIRQYGNAGSDKPALLRDLKVIEIGTNTTAPLAAKHLAALGADVTKVEAPTGDPARHSGTMFSDRNSVIFHLTNTDKHGVRLDLKERSGLIVLKELLGDADILIDNLKPGKLAEFGLGPDTLAAVCPGLAHCSITGFGQSCSRAFRLAYDIVVQGTSGLMAANAFDGRPLKIGASICDLLGAQMALVHALAQVRRGRPGPYTHVDIAMHDSVVWLMSSASQIATALDIEKSEIGRPSRVSNRHQLSPPDAVRLADVLRLPQTQHRGLLKRIGGMADGLSVLETPLRIRGANTGVKYLFQDQSAPRRI